ncbi:F-box domain-containing protein [Mycena sanguinolenta]|uniref:F-box domain-containing protein n=1 Tax=Mycena sanguinolenta TaxID=230812 RepID=A0A8H7DDI3_9AGAR|nr:F-box domain-containing protein [Mycena sanguinolenta]
MLSWFAADRARVADLDAEILVHERALSALRIQRARAQERLDSYKYPVMTLPNEIITEIFLHFLPTYPDRPPTRGLHSPTLLTQICCQWREIALRTPTLWRAITLPPRAERAAQFDAWLARARGCPLSLFINMDRSREEGSLSTVVPYRAQLEYLVVFQGLPSHLRAIEGPLPRLRHLELLFHDQDDPPTGSKVSFLETPLLRTALLDFTGLQYIVLPWAQLTSLALDGVYPPRVCSGFTANIQPRALRTGFIGTPEHGGCS